MQPAALQRGEKAAMAAQMDQVDEVRAEAKAIRERNEEMQKRWDEAAAAAAATAAAAEIAKAKGNNTTEGTADGAGAGDAKLWEELAESQRAMTSQAAALEKSAAAEASLRIKLKAAEGEIAALRTRCDVGSCTSCVSPS
jgi:hypothetical protein